MKKIAVMIMAAFSALMMVSCDKYEDGRPQKSVINEFKRMYPDAFDVEWEWQGTNWEVSFETGKRPNGIEHEAWYDTDGNWIRTETDLLLANVPQNIKDYLAADPTYGNAYNTDHDVDYIQTPDGEYYRFELLVGGVQVRVDVTPDGKVTLANGLFSY